MKPYSPVKPQPDPTPKTPKSAKPETLTPYQPHNTLQALIKLYSPYKKPYSPLYSPIRPYSPCKTLHSPIKSLKA